MLEPPERQATKELTYSTLLDRLIDAAEELDPTYDPPKRGPLVFTWAAVGARQVLCRLPNLYHEDREERASTEAVITAIRPAAPLRRIINARFGPIDPTYTKVRFTIPEADDDDSKGIVWYGLPEQGRHLPTHYNDLFALLADGGVFTPASIPRRAGRMVIDIVAAHWESMSRLGPGPHGFH